MKTKIKNRILISFFVLILLFFIFESASSSFSDYAFAEQLSGGENLYTKIFTISAYYSPLPCQNKYATGSYERDIRLNGGGVHGADGTSVYPGMVAAPRDFDFGTKMHIPGIGIVAVHDRGGAIKASNGIDGVYDRLDVWMGYGDKGLKRALQWGKRTMDVVVYGVNDLIVEEITLDDYSLDESVPNQCVMPVNSPAEVLPEVVSEATFEAISYYSGNLQVGSSGNAVYALQNELRRLNFLRINPTGYYGEVTEHAVFKFQQSQRLVWDKNSSGAGIFGPKTKDRLNEIIATRDYTVKLIAQATNSREKEIRILATELDFGMVHPEVANLQKFLKDKGYFTSPLITTYFGPATKSAVVKFQIENGVVNSGDEHGAGRVGPETLDLINNFS